MKLPDNNQHHLSTQKEERHIKKFVNKAMSADKDLTDHLDNGDKEFTDHTATEADAKSGIAAAKHNHVGNTKYATTSKTDPANSKLDGETFLTDLKKGDKNFTDETADNDDVKYGTKPPAGKGTKPPTKDHNLSVAVGAPKTMTTSPSITGKSIPSNKKLDQEKDLSVKDNFTYMMGFNKFVNESYDPNESK